MSHCWIALGGNLGDVARTLQQATTILAEHPAISVTRVSRHYGTVPVGQQAGSRFLNAAAELQTTLEPLELLDELQFCEARLGRTRSIHWGPRTLDLDLLLYEQQIFHTPRLTIPHPHLWYRRFVLDPLVEIAPDQIHPVHHLSISQLQCNLLQRPLSCALIGGTRPAREELQQAIAAEFPDTWWWIEGDQATCPTVWLAFDLDSQVGRSSSQSLRSAAPVATGFIPSANVISLASFPTTPLDSIRNVLTAAL